jgi:hypothetical protein
VTDDVIEFLVGRLQVGQALVPDFNIVEIERLDCPPGLIHFHARKFDADETGLRIARSQWNEIAAGGAAQLQDAGL